MYNPSERHLFEDLFVMFNLDICMLLILCLHNSIFTFSYSKKLEYLVKFFLNVQELHQKSSKNASYRLSEIIEECHFFLADFYVDPAGKLASLHQQWS